jgi:hypothetical protein
LHQVQCPRGELPGVGYHWLMGTGMRAPEKQDAGVERTDIHEQVSRWLSAVLLDTGGLEPPVEIMINHAAVDQHRRLIRSYRMETLPVPADELLALTDAVAQTIAADGEDLGGVQRYQLMARSAGREVGSKSLRYATDTPPSAIDSEPASARGLVAQAQRHAEAAVRMLVQGNGSLLTSFQKRLADQDALIERLYNRWIDSMETKEQLVRERAILGIDADERKVESEVRAAREIAEIERKNALWTEALSMVKFGFPFAMQYLMGGKGELPAQQEAAQAAYLATVTDQQIEQLRARLPPEVLDDFVAKVRKARGTTQAATAPPQDPAPPQEATTPPAAPSRSFKPLEGDAKLGAARLLARDLLPLITERHLAGRPLIDAASDDLSLYQLLKRLAASSSEVEMQMILGSLPDEQRDATVALLEFLNITLPGSGGGGGAG